MTEPLHWPNVPPTTWPPPSAKRWVLTSLPLTMVILALLVAFRMSGSSGWWLAAILVFSIVVVPAARVRAGDWERRRIATRIDAGVPPWDAAGHWRHAGVRTQFQRPGWRRWFVVVPVMALFQGLFGGATWWFYVAFVGALPLAVVTLRGILTGRAGVHWLHTPCRTGEPATFAVSVDLSGSDASELRVWLRSVRTTPATMWSAPQARVLGIHSPDGVPPDSAGPAEEVLVTFDIPSNAPGTDLAAREPTHWEVVVVARTSWGRIEEVVPVPVYAVPA
jgi:hypothetical protein